jgi:uncharacterized Fe-S cluster-containing radical SAM superfamily protein
MPQKTNLNVSPYYDDFDKDKNFYKVLFKPGYPVQARELSTLQSILQNQIESFGSHIFKEGSMVIPGAITYDNQYFSVKINPENSSILVSTYLDQLVGKKIRGKNSNIIATVQNYSIPPNDGVEDVTLYVKYLSSGDSLEIAQFDDGEPLGVEENITYGFTTISAGETVATVVDNDATSVGCAVGITKGIYFLRGSFVQVNDSFLVLDPYSNEISCRVGLKVVENIITSNDDSSLNDNSRGFSNFAAPGADRLQITTVLAKKEIDDFNDIDFTEILRIDRGLIKKLQDTSVYSIIRDYFAKRTYEESGNYSLNNFNIDLQNSLDDGISNNGIYSSKQKTQQNNTPSDDLVCVKISPGKAYVWGYDIDIPSTVVLDVPKPRQTERIVQSQVPFEMGNRIRVNRVQGTPIINLNNANNVIDLQNKFIDETGISTIGQARVYAYNLTDSPYSGASTQWDLYLFDVQTYTIIEVNEALSPTECRASAYIRGLKSGASGYAVESTNNSKLIKITQTSGSFMVGEEIIINEDQSFGRVVKSIKSFSTEDIKSVKQNTVSLGGSDKFLANTALLSITPTNFSPTDKILIDNTGKVTIPARVGQNFLGIKTDSIIRYQRVGQDIETYNRIESISADGFSMQLASMKNVVGVFTGGLPSSNTETKFSLGIPDFRGQLNGSLYAKLNNKNISSVELSDANLVVNKQFINRTTNASGVMILNISDSGDVGISTAFFEPFDQERYSIIYSNGTIEDLTSDQVSVEAGSSQILFSGLIVNQTNVTVNTTIRKAQVKSKTKVFVRSEKLIVDKTNAGAGSSISGLSTSQYYGLRVEDPEISLNVPDVTNIVAIYESLDTSQPVLDSLTFGAGYNLDTATILGEKIIGQNSGAIAQLVTRVDSSKVEFVYLNTKVFEVGEEVLFEESKIQIVLDSVTNGIYKNLTTYFSFDKNQKNQYYDYSRIVRPLTVTPPTRQLLVIFNYFDIPTNDTGDIITVNSYPEERFAKDIPLLSDGTRSSDTLDFRPRVVKFAYNDRSPFDFSAKVFLPVSSANIAPNESSIIGYSYYLPRTDLVVLNKSGEFSVIRGTPSLTPKAPLNNEEVMDIATITYPAYLYSPDNARINLIDNKRYTMRDIGKLENRIRNLEYTTSLSLLELDTKTLQIQDADGLSRFKTGFFVDDFKTNNLIQKNNPDVRCDVNIEAGELIPPIDYVSLKAELALSPEISPLTADFSRDLPLLDPNIKKTGDIVTLNYTEVEWLKQSFASDFENVNPYNVIVYQGEVRLTPVSDTWVKNIYILNQTVTNITDVVTIRPFWWWGWRWWWGSRVRSGWWWGWPAGRWNFNTSTSTRVDTVESVVTTNEPDPFFRSRNVQFVSNGLKPYTRHYSFLDNNGGIDVIPKLIEIAMVSGVFIAGETISVLSGSTAIATFRLAKIDHKFGNYLNPDVVYEENPYTRDLMPTAYSASSTILNIDTFCLADEAFSSWNGYILKGAQIVGQTSKATATVSDIRLITDIFGDLIGAFFIRDPNTSPPPPVRIPVGERTFKITADPTNATITDRSIDQISEASATYSGSGTISTQTTTRNITIRTTVVRRARRRDPLAQSFTTDETGAFLTSVDVYFNTKDTIQNLFVELRTMDLGLPTNELVQEYAQVTVTPKQIKTSSRAAIPTRITFPSPIYLAPNTEYALVFLCPTSDKYTMWTSTNGKKTIESQNLPDAQSVYITRQYLGGSLFKSQNGTIWTPSQYQDLKFTLYKAKFTASAGDVTFYNPSITNGTAGIDVPSPTVSPLPPNPIETLPRKIVVGISTVLTSETSTTSVFSIGRRIRWRNAWGYIERIGGPIRTGSLTIVNTGIGYSSTGADTVYTDVPLYTISGKGKGAVGIVTVAADGTIKSVSITKRGNGYAIGDVLGITTSFISKGRNAIVSVSNLYGFDTLFLTNVKGEKFISIYDGAPSDELSYYTSSGVSTPITGVQVSVTSQVLSPIFTGNIIRVNHFNHGHHGLRHLVRLANIAPNTVPISIVSPIGLTDTVISVANTSEFTFFEGRRGTSGYVTINGEVMRYSGIGNGTLIIAQRGINGTPIRWHYPGFAFIRRYEISGFSLTKINRTHAVNSVLTAQSTVVDYDEIDRYYLRVPREEDREEGEEQQNFTDGGFYGGLPGPENPIASQNNQFNTLLPQFSIITPGKTTVSSRVRTISGTTPGGSESSFIDQGYQSVELNKTNYFKTPRLVASNINESEYLTNLPNNKSLTLQVRMITEDENLSPILDLQNTTIILGRNRINNPIKDYTSDNRVNLLQGDPHSAIYISNRIDLKQSATSLKAYISACRPPGTDFRMLYQLFRPDSSEVSQTFELFPGYDNLVDTGIGLNIIDKALNSGRADRFVRPSQDDEFLEYEFSVDNLDKFTGFAIKIVMSSLNEAIPVRFRDLRCIALA